MRIERRIILWWSVYLLLSLAGLLLPHRSFPWIAVVNYGLQVLLGLICLYTVAHERVQTRPIFFNFATFFFFAIPGQLTIYAGSLLFPATPYATVYYHQYVNKLGYTLVLAFPVVYVAIDYLGRNLRIFQKYLLTAVIVLAIFYPLYSAYFEDPLRLYQRAEYVEFTHWNSIYEEAIRKLDGEPSDAEMLQLFTAANSRLGTPLSPGVLREQLEKYRPFFGGANATTLFWRPLNMRALFVNAFLLVVIGIVFVFKFLRDYPHAAYVEKILQTFFVYSGFEMLHHWSFNESASYEIYRSILEIGQYATILTLLAMVYVFSMRLRFVLTAVGKYYEEMVVAQPDQVTRWRDEIDNVVLRYFFKGKKYLGRLASFQSNHLRDTNRREDQL